jgi:inward rectifier potassium channel
MIYQTAADKIWETFFFSAQTLTTVGYGRLNPSGLSASTLAACESFTGLMGFALATGLLYGRFSRPTAKLLYSENALISPYRHKRFDMQDMTAFMFRIANARNNQLIEIEAQVLFTYNQERNGEIIRSFQVLDLEIAKVSYLSLSWTIVHPITEKSPMYGLTAEDLLNIDAEFMINIKAVDDGYAQQVYSRSSYKADEIVFNAKFVSAISRLESGLSAVDLKKISEYDMIS